MTSATPIPATDEQETATKRHWDQPSFNRIEIGAAAAGDGSGPDAGFNPS